MKKFSLDGKVAVVTGAFGKLGPIWIKALLESGAKVAAIDLPQANPPQNIYDLCREAGENLKFFKADVTDKKNLFQVRGEIKWALGEADILVNNAGVDQPPGAAAKNYKLEDIPAEIFKYVFDVNVFGAFQAAQVFGENMAKKGGGSIINIGSLYGTVSPDARNYDHLPSEPPFLKPPAYGASKAALINLTKYMATHWASAGIRVNTLSPGGVEGGQDPEFKRKFCDRVPMKRMAQAKDLGGPLVFLASDASSYVTGENLKVDGGFTLW